jgi:hypothetical protein
VAAVATVPDREAVAVGPEADRRMTAPEAVVVHRPDPPVADADGPAGGSSTAAVKVKLTPDEIRALLAVEGARRPTPLQSTWRRGRVIVVPVGILGFVIDHAFGAAGPWITLGLTLAALAYIAAPLVRRDGWS